MLKHNSSTSKSALNLSSPNITIGFIGAGNMAYAIIEGFIKSGVHPSNIKVSSKTGRSFEKFKKLGVETTLKNSDNFTQDLVIYAAKPYQFSEIFGEFEKSSRSSSGSGSSRSKDDSHQHADSSDRKSRDKLSSTSSHKETSTPNSKTTCSRSSSSLDEKKRKSTETRFDIQSWNKVFISVAAGISIKKYRYYLRSAHIYRMMPNTPCLVSKGCMAIAPDPRGTPSCTGPIDPKYETQIFDLFRASGIIKKIPENQIDAICGLSGSGPAFIYTLIEAMSDSGVKNGLSRDVATEFAAMTFAGAAEMVLKTGQHTGQLKDAVTSSGGTTIAGIYALEKAGGRNAIMEAVDAATKRAREIGKE